MTCHKFDEPALKLLTSIHSVNFTHEFLQTSRKIVNLKSWQPTP